MRALAHILERDRTPREPRGWYLERYDIHAPERWSVVEWYPRRSLALAARRHLVFETGCADHRARVVDAEGRNR